MRHEVCRAGLDAHVQYGFLDPGNGIYSAPQSTFIAPLTVVFHKYIYITSPYFLKLSELWVDWPRRELDGLTKGYVLAQLAYWTQQLLVVHLEARRHDYWQMIAHHFATIALISSAYVYHHIQVSNLIFILMDIIELIFPVRCPTQDGKRC